MYRCYLIRNGRIALGDDAETLAGALEYGRRQIASQPASGPFSGMEIWRGGSLVYNDTAYGEANGSPAAIDSPFQTAESTILPNWCRSLSRPTTRESTSEADQPPAARGPRRAIRRPALREPVAA